VYASNSEHDKQKRCVLSNIRYWVATDCIFGCCGPHKVTGSLYE